MTDHIELADAALPDGYLHFVDHVDGDPTNSEVGNLQIRVYACAFERALSSAVACDRPVAGFRQYFGQNVPACQHHLVRGGIFHRTAAERLVVSANRRARLPLLASLSVAVADALRACDVDAAEWPPYESALPSWGRMVVFGECGEDGFQFTLEPDADGGIVTDRHGDLLGACSGGIPELVALCVQIALEDVEDES